MEGLGLGAGETPAVLVEVTAVAADGDLARMVGESISPVCEFVDSCVDGSIASVSAPSAVPAPATALERGRDRATMDAKADI